VLLAPLRQAPPGAGAGRCQGLLVSQQTNPPSNCESPAALNTTPLTSARRPAPPPLQPPRPSKGRRCGAAPQSAAPHRLGALRARWKPQVRTKWAGGAGARPQLPRLCSPPSLPPGAAPPLPDFRPLLVPACPFLLQY
jgi:hypothetical protein